MAPENIINISQNKSLSDCNEIQKKITNKCKGKWSIFNSQKETKECKQKMLKMLVKNARNASKK